MQIAHLMEMLASSRWASEMKEEERQKQSTPHVIRKNSQKIKSVNLQQICSPFFTRLLNPTFEVGISSNILLSSKVECLWSKTSYLSASINETARILLMKLEKCLLLKRTHGFEMHFKNDSSHDTGSIRSKIWPEKFLYMAFSFMSIYSSIFSLVCSWWLLFHWIFASSS